MSALWQGTKTKLFQTVTALADRAPGAVPAGTHVALTMRPYEVDTVIGP